MIITKPKRFIVFILGQFRAHAHAVHLEIGCKDLICAAADGTKAAAEMHRGLRTSPSSSINKLAQPHVDATESKGCNLAFVAMSTCRTYAS